MTEPRGLAIGDHIKCSTFASGMHGIEYTWKDRPFYLSGIKLLVNQGWRPAWLERKSEAHFLICYEMPRGRQSFHDWIAKPEWPFFEYVRTVNPKRPGTRWQDAFCNLCFQCISDGDEHLAPANPDGSGTVLTVCDRCYHDGPHNTDAEEASVRY